VPALAKVAHAARRQGADGQHLGHPPLPAVQAWRGRVDPGGDKVRRRALRRADRQRHGEFRGGLADAARRLTRAGAVCQSGRLLADAARAAHHGRSVGAAGTIRPRSGALARDSGRSGAGAASSPARRTRSRDLEAGFHRRLLIVRRGVPAGHVSREHPRVRRGSGVVRDRRILGRVRESRVADDRLCDPHRQSAVRGTVGAVAYRARGREGPDR
jgi:hypothetical protein